MLKGTKKRTKQKRREHMSRYGSVNLEIYLMLERIEIHSIYTVLVGKPTRQREKG